MNFRRINLYGGPSSGKSTMASKIFTELKESHMSVEFCQEPIKQWTYLDRLPGLWDQIVLFGQELSNEEIALRKMDVVVVDSPLLLNCYYSALSTAPFVKSQISIAQDFEREFPSLNLFCTRGKYPYQRLGRFHTVEEALQMDQKIYDFLSDVGITVHKVDTRTDVMDILSYAK